MQYKITYKFVFFYLPLSRQVVDCRESCWSQLFMLLFTNIVSKFETAAQLREIATLSRETVQLTLVRVRVRTLYITGS